MLKGSNSSKKELSPKKEDYGKVRLFIGSIPTTVSKCSLQTAIRETSDGEKISKFHMKRKSKSSRSFAFFETTSVPLAIKLSSRPLKLKDKELYCQISHKSLMRLKSQLNMRGCVKHLPKDVPDRLIAQHLEELSDSGIDSFYSIKTWKMKSKGYGFVDFKDPDDVKKLVNLGEIEAFGSNIKIEAYVAKDKEEEVEEKEISQRRKIEEKSRQSESLQEFQLFNTKKKLEKSQKSKKSKKKSKKKSEEKIGNEKKKNDDEVIPKLANIDPPCVDKDSSEENLLKDERKKVGVWGINKTNKLIIMASEAKVKKLGENYRLNREIGPRYNDFRINKRTKFSSFGHPYYQGY